MDLLAKTYTEHAARSGRVILIRISLRIGVGVYGLRKSWAGPVFLPQNRPSNRKNQEPRRTEMIEQKRRAIKCVGS